MSQLAHRSRPQFTLFLATALVMSLAVRATSQEAPRWPREFSQKDGSKLTVYQPQVDEWQGYRKLKARAAVFTKLHTGPDI